MSESNLPELPTHQPSKSDKAREIELLGRFIGVQEQEIKQRASEAQGIAQSMT